MKNIISETKTKSGKTISFRYPTIDDAEILMNYINKISAEQSFILFQGHQQTLEAETKWLNDKLEKINNNQAVYICTFFQNKLIGCGEIDLGSNVSVERLSAIHVPSPTQQSRLIIPNLSTWRSVAEFNPDIIHTHTFFGAGIEAIRAARKLKIPLLTEEKFVEMSLE